MIRKGHFFIIIKEIKMIISPVTIDEFKQHLQLDDDLYSDEKGIKILNQYLLAATNLAEHILQREIIKRTDDNAIAESIVDVPEVVKQYVLTQASDYFYQRELSGERTFNTYHKHLLDAYRLY